MINGVGVASTSINDEGSMGIKTCVYRIGNISDIRPKQPSVNLEKEREKNSIFCSVRQAINSSTTFRIPNCRNRYATLSPVTGMLEFNGGCNIILSEAPNEK